jgi:hypothetical protein
MATPTMLMKKQQQVLLGTCELDRSTGAPVLIPCDSTGVCNPTRNNACRKVGYYQGALQSTVSILLFSDSYYSTKRGSFCH